MKKTKTNRLPLRDTLLASVFAAGMIATLAAGAIITDTRYALAEPVRVDAPAPADFTAVVEGVKPAVVAVQVKNKVRPVADRENRQRRGFRDRQFRDNPFDEFFRHFDEPRRFGDRPQRPRRALSQGSGFFISEDGYVVTNNHVVEGGDELIVVTDDGRELEAKLIGSDRRTDLALLKVEGTGFTYVEFADDKPPIGQWVVAVGNPFGLGGTVTAGIVSAHGRDIGSGPYDDFIQIDAPVNRGNSGGPTFNTRGEVVGVNTAIFSPSGGNVGIAFAIPAATVEAVIDDLRSDGSVTRGWLGVQIQRVTRDIAESLDVEPRKGALVSDPQDDGPAKGAGIEAGDVIVKVDDQDIANPRDLARKIAAYAPGETVTVTVIRDGKEMVIDVTLGKLENQARAESDDEEKSELAAAELLGLELAPNEDGGGVLVSGVATGSAAAERGIRAGDVIKSVGGEDVASAKDVAEQIDAARDGDRKSALFHVEGERGSRFIALPLDES